MEEPVQRLDEMRSNDFRSGSLSMLPMLRNVPVLWMLWITATLWVSVATANEYLVSENLAAESAQEVNLGLDRPFGVYVFAVALLLGCSSGHAAEGG